MNQDLWTKLVNEEPLDAAECLLLEQMLESGDGSPISQHLKAARAVEPSLAWRSGLNQRLRQMAPVKPHRARRWFAFGAVAACACALWIAFAPRGTASPSTSPRQSMIADNHEAQPSELTEVLISAHQADEAQASMGYRPARNGKTRLATYQQW